MKTLIRMAVQRQWQLFKGAICKNLVQKIKKELTLSAYCEEITVKMLWQRGRCAVLKRYLLKLAGSTTTPLVI